MKIRNHRKRVYHVENGDGRSFRTKSSLMKYLTKNLDLYINKTAWEYESCFGASYSRRTWFIWYKWDYKRNIPVPRLIPFNLRNNNTYFTWKVSKECKKTRSMSEKIFSLMTYISRSKEIDPRNAKNLVRLFEKSGFKDFEIKGTEDEEYYNHFLIEGNEPEFDYWSDRCNYVRRKIIYDYFKKMWLNINFLDLYEDLIYKIGFRKGYSLTTRSWLYWNRFVYDRYKKFYRIIENSVGKSWDEVYSKLLSLTPEKHKHLVYGNHFRPDDGYIKDGTLYLSYKWGDRVAMKGCIFLDESSIIRRADSGYVRKKFPNKKEKESYYDKKILAWVNNSDYAYITDTTRRGIIVKRDREFCWTEYLEGERISHSSSFENMIAWFEHNSKSYLVLHRGLLFYSENFNKTML